METEQNNADSPKTDIENISTGVKKLNTTSTFPNNAFEVMTVKTPKGEQDLHPSMKLGSMGESGFIVMVFVIALGSLAIGKMMERF